MLTLATEAGSSFLVARLALKSPQSSEESFLFFWSLSWGQTMPSAGKQGATQTKRTQSQASCWLEPKELQNETLTEQQQTPTCLRPKNSAKSLFHPSLQPLLTMQARVHGHCHRRRCEPFALYRRGSWKGKISWEGGQRRRCEPNGFCGQAFAKARSAGRVVCPLLDGSQLLLGLFVGSSNGLLKLVPTH